MPLAEDVHRRIRQRRAGPEKTVSALRHDIIKDDRTGLQVLGHSFRFRPGTGKAEGAIQDPPDDCIITFLRVRTYATAFHLPDCTGRHSPL